MSLLILMAGSASFNREQPQANVPTIKKPDAWITVQDYSLVASVMPTLPLKFASQGTLTGRLDEYYLYSLISQYDWDADKMYQVMLCESGGNPNTRNPEYHKKGNCYGSYGLFQIGCLNYAGNPEDLYGPELNIKIAFEVYQKQGWQAWQNCW